MIEAQRNASLATKIGRHFEALAWDGYSGAFRAMGIDRASDNAAALLRKIGPMTSTHKVSRINMQRCFPDAAEPELDRLLGQMWDGFGRLVGEMPNMHRFADPDFFNERVEFVGREHLERARDEGRAVVIISMHQSNWELAAAAIMQTGLNCHITYRPANNPLIDNRIMKTRADYGVKLMAAKGGDGAKALIGALKKGESVALMNDQKMNDGVEAPFFGHPSMTAPGPTRLAMRHGYPLMPISVRRLDGVRFRVTIHDPIELSANNNKSTAVVETVTRINQWAESVIRDAPEQWFWVHRRWDKAVYRKG
ncbi:MAG: lysophospholipid acyltransferase family protein [Maricaulis sp.]|jgi:KDO2-lipid IV(A) lauroyltransferase|nr:lysophospholipid acyltransferase family protein [Maricaulis sp.]MDG2044158.1 lysophospholipid acyltransferase family protein [Maricaulis sp.]